MHVHEVHVELLGEHLFHFFGLVLAQKPMVHEYAGQLLADGTCAQCGHHRRIHAAGKAQDHAVASHLLADCRHGVLDDRVHGPGGLKAADVEQEVAQQLVAVFAVTYLGMELRGEQLAFGAFHGGHGAYVGGRGDDETFGHAVHRIAVAHPYGLLGGSVAIQGAFALAHDHGRAVFALFGMAHRTAQRNGHNLLAVAKAQHGNAKLKHARVDLRGVFGVHAGRAAGQDDCGGVHGGKFVGRHVAGDDSRKHAQVSDAAGNELSVLCAEI